MEWLLAWNYRALSLPLFCAGAVALLISAFFGFLYRRVRGFGAHRPARHGLFSLLSLANSVFLFSFGALVSVDEGIVHETANRFVIASSSLMIAVATHFYALYLGLDRGRARKTVLAASYIAAAVFAVLSFIPGGFFLTSKPFRTSSWYVGLEYGPGLRAWSAWAFIAMSMAIAVLAIGVRKRFKEEKALADGPPDPERFPLKPAGALALSLINAFWLISGILDDLTAMQLIDFPPSTWIGSFAVVLSFAYLLCDEISTLYLERKSLYEEVIKDSLTGSFSRGFFEVEFAKRIALSKRDSAPVCLILIDCDDFKAVNDTFGHDAGDRLLKAVAAALAGTVRPSDVVARFGGDEFIVLPGSPISEEAARGLCRRLIEAVGAIRIDTRAEALASSCSIGCALMLPSEAESEESAATIFKLADEALYESKRGGKSRATVRTPA